MSVISNFLLEYMVFLMKNIVELFDAIGSLDGTWQEATEGSNQKLSKTHISQSEVTLLQGGIYRNII